MFLGDPNMILAEKSSFQLYIMKLWSPWEVIMMKTRSECPQRTEKVNEQGEKKKKFYLQTEKWMNEMFLWRKSVNNIFRFGNSLTRKGMKNCKDSAIYHKI